MIEDIVSVSKALYLCRHHIPLLGSEWPQREEFIFFEEILQSRKLGKGCIRSLIVNKKKPNGSRFVFIDKTQKNYIDVFAYQPLLVMS